MTATMTRFARHNTSTKTRADARLTFPSGFGCGKGGPRRSRKEDHRLLRLAALPAILLCLAVAAVMLAFAPTAQAATLIKNGNAEDVPPDTVSIEFPLEIDKAEFFTDNEGFSVADVRVWETNATGIVYEGPVQMDGSIEGSFTLIWRKAGVDDDGDDIDLTVKVSNVKTNFRHESLLLVDDSTYLCLDAMTKSMGDASVGMDIWMRVTKHGTDQPAAGTMLVAFTDLDIVKSEGKFTEQIELLEGFGDTVWVPSTNFLNISDDATRFTATQADLDTYDSGFVTTADTTGFSVRWQGDSCGTYALMPFRAEDQLIKASSSEGGTISDEGVTMVRWKNDKTYTFHPDSTHRLKDVIVNGESQLTAEGKLPENGYTFKRVTKSQTIHVEFEKIPTYSVEFKDGFGNLVSYQQVQEGTAAKAPPNPQAEGWAFKGWDRDFSSVTEDLVVAALWDPLISVRVPALLACRIMLDGSVMEPGGYEIENLSPVAVEIQSITTTGMPSYGSYTLTDGTGAAIHSFADGTDAPGKTATMDARSDLPLSWSIGDIKGQQAQELLLRAVKSPTKLCDVAFTFKMA